MTTTPDQRIRLMDAFESILARCAIDGLDPLGDLADVALAARPAPVVSGADDQSAAVRADERMGGYGYRHSPAWRYAYLAALGITVADTLAADEGGQDR